MKTFTTLIRLSKRTLDEFRKKQVSLENQKAQLQQAIRNLIREMEDEQALAIKKPEMGSFFGGFAKRVKERQETLQQEISKVDAQLATVAEEIMKAFAELKKYEIAYDNAKLRIKQEADRKETAEMDEIAGMRHQRKKEE